MAKSQLKQLKESLKAQGLVGSIQGKKGRKNVDKHKSRADREEAVQAIRAAFNPFDVKTTRQKQDVLGRKITGAQGKPGISKQIGEEQRRRAYEAEKARKNKVGGVMDRRFGENDATMDPEEKMLARFTAERLNQSRKSKSLFDLDDDEEADVLTHYGKSLAVEDDFEDDDLGLDEDEDEEVVQRVKRAREAQQEAEDEEEQPVKKSKKEVMEEIIAKSKAYKHERQQAKQEDQEQIEELDDEMEGLYENLRQAGAYGDDAHANNISERELEYEKRLRELAFDRRAAPSDRTKTEEELAKQKAAELVRLEKERQARMEGETGDGVEDLGGEYLEEGESEDDEAKMFGLMGEQSDSEEGEDEEEDEDEDEDDDQFGEEPEFEEDEDEDEDDADEENGKSEPSTKDVKSSKSTAFVFACPQTISAFDKILKKYPVTDYPVIVERILTLHHPSVKPGNKEKLAVFSTVLAEAIMEFPTRSTDMGVFDALVKHLRKMADTYVEALTNFFRERLSEVGDRLAEVRTDASAFPEKSDLVMFALIGILFSTSDHYHLVATAATLLAAQYLSQVQVDSARAVFCGLYLSSVLIAYQRISKRFVPEIPVFLLRVLYRIFPELNDKAPVADAFLDNDDREGTALKLAVSALDKAETQSTLALSVLDELDDNKVGSDLLSQLALKAVEVTSKLATLWNEKTAFIETFAPLSAALQSLETKNTQVKTASDKLERLLKFARQERRPLTLQGHRPLAIPSLAPKFEENYSLDRKSYDPNRDRAELNKLRAQVKKERKATLRDIRRDTAFMAREKISTRRQADKEYHEKLARLERTIATEEGAEKNAYEREKKARKRANRK